MITLAGFALLFFASRALRTRTEIRARRLKALIRPGKDGLMLPDLGTYAVPVLSSYACRWGC